jgi:hypothetical protein
MGAKAPKLLGIYEKEILRLMQNRVFAGRSTLVDIGAADGYFAVGSLVGDVFQRAIAFELSKQGRRALAETAILNGVRDRLTIKGKATKTLAEELRSSGVRLGDSVILCDAEGAEYEIFTPEMLSLLTDCHIIIELHDYTSDRCRSRTLVEEAKRYFDVEILTTGARDLSSFSVLREYGDNARWLLASEGRYNLMEWAWLKPRGEAGRGAGVA